MDLSVTLLDDIVDNSNCENQNHGCAVVQASVIPEDISSVSEQHQVIVPSATCRSDFTDNGIAVHGNLTTNATPTIVSSKDNTTCTLFLSPLLFSSNHALKKGLTYVSNCLSSIGLPKKGPLDISSQSEEESTQNKTGVDPLANGPNFATTKGRQHTAVQQGTGVSVDDRRSSVMLAMQPNSFSAQDAKNSHSSSEEAEDSLGDLLSKHFDTDCTDNAVSSCQRAPPSSEIEKQRSNLVRTNTRHVCNVCHRECPSKHKLRRHLSTHSEERPFTCQLCGRTFKWTEYLQKHMRQQHLQGGEAYLRSPPSSPAPKCTHQSVVASVTETATSPSVIGNKEPRQKQSNKPRTKVKSVKNKRKMASKTKTAKTTVIASQHRCPVHCNETFSTQNNVMIETSSEVVSETISPPTDTPTKDHDTSDNISISSPVIPETQSVSVGVDMDEEVLETPRSSHSEVDAFDMACENISGSTRLAHTDLSRNFSTAVSDVMAEPIPSNCIGTNGAMNVGEILTTGAIEQQTMGGQEKGNSGNNGSEMQCHQVLEQDFQHCFTLNSTSNNNSILSQEYPHQHLQLLSSSVPGPSMSSYSSPIMQHQPNNLHISSHDLTMSVQSNSDSMPVSGSNSMQPFHVQGDTRTDPLSNTLLSQNHNPLNTVNQTCSQPPDLIPIGSVNNNSPFPILQQQPVSNLVLDQQNANTNGIGHFTYPDPGSDMSNQYSIQNSGMGFNDSCVSGLDGVSDISSPQGYLMQPLTSPGIGMCDSYLPGPSYLDIQQARQLLFENTQQMKRILRSYQSLQNTLLRVTAGTQAALLSPMTYDGVMGSQGLMSQHQDHMIQQQSNEVNHMTIIQDHLMQQELGSKESMNQVQDLHNLSNNTDFILQSGELMMSQQQSNGCDQMISQQQPNGSDRMMSQQQPNGSEHMMSQQQPNGSDHMMSQQQPNGSDHIMSQQQPNGSDHMMSQQQPNGSDHMMSQQQPNGSDHIMSQQQPNGSDHIMSQQQPNGSDMLNQQQHNGSDHMLNQQQLKPNGCDQMMRQQQFPDSKHLLQSDDQLIFCLLSDPDNFTVHQDHQTQVCDAQSLHEMTYHCLNVPTTSDTTPIVVHNFDPITPPSLIPYEPSDLLTPVSATRVDNTDPGLPPPEKRPRLDNQSSYDIGIQCELGPETIVALIMEEAGLVQGVEEHYYAANGDGTEEESDSAPTGDGTALGDVQQDSKENETESEKDDRTVNKYPCEVEGCVKAYVHRKDLTRHMKIHHGVLPKMLKAVAIETAKKPYFCPVHSCGRSYFHLRDLRRHQRACHRVDSQVDADNQSNVGAKKASEGNDSINKLQLRYPCDFPGCVRSYVHRKDLVRHKRSYHKDLSVKPTVSNPIPYTFTDLRIIRKEVKFEVEQFMKKVRKGSVSSIESISPCSSDSTLHSATLTSPGLILSSFDTSFLRTKLEMTVISEVDKELSETPVSSTTAQLISLIHTLTTSSPSSSQMSGLMQFPLSIEVPDIPKAANSDLASSSLPEAIKGKSSGDSSCSGLKEVLLGTSKNKNKAHSSSNRETRHIKNKTWVENQPPTIISSSALTNDSSSKQQLALPMQNTDLNSLLAFSPRQLVASSLESEHNRDSSLPHSLETLSSLAAEALSMSENELSNVFMRTVSCSPDLITFSQPIDVSSVTSEKPSLECCFEQSGDAISVEKTYIDAIVNDTSVDKTCIDVIDTSVEKTCIDAIVNDTSVEKTCIDAIDTSVEKTCIDAIVNDTSVEKTCIDVIDTSVEKTCIDAIVNDTSVEIICINAIVNDTCVDKTRTRIDISSTLG